MKTAALFCIIIALASCVRVKSSMQLSFESKVEDLKKTGWGRIAAGLMELQIATGGPMQELVTAFQNLIKDLNFKVGTTQEQYRWDKAEHWELDKEINYRLRDARVRFGVATAHLTNTLYPSRANLEHLIATDEALIALTHSQIEQATAERAAAKALFDTYVVEHNLAMEAVQECQVLVQGLLNGGATLIQVRKTKKHLTELSQQMKGMNGYTHIAKALVELLNGEFVDETAVGKVYGLLQDLFDNLVESLADLNTCETNSIAAFEAYLVVCWDTIHAAEDRVDRNTAALEVVNAEIAHQEELRDTAEADRDQATEELEIETARWDAYVASYEDLMAELMSEMDAVDRCIDVFANANLNADMMDVVNH